MNPYVDYLVVQVKGEADGSLLRETRVPVLNRKGEILSARLDRLDQALQPIEQMCKCIGFFAGLVVAGAFIWLTATEHPLMMAFYDWARRDLPGWLGLLLLNDLMPLLWLFLLGSVLGTLLAAPFFVVPAARIRRLRSRIISKHPFLPEAIATTCKR